MADSRQMVRQVRRRRLYEDIVQQFHGLMRQGALQPGDRLPAERELAEQFKVSRSSVREAMQALELQGLVVSKRGSGTFVSMENLEAALDLVAANLNGGTAALPEVFEMRHLMEPQIAALAAERATAEEVGRLREILTEQQRQIDAGETGVAADTAFHFTLAAATHNSALVKVVSAIEDILQASRDRSLQEPGRPERSLASHGQIVAMVERGDAAGARRAMNHHLTAIEPAAGVGPYSNGVRVEYLPVLPVSAGD